MLRQRMITGLVLAVAVILAILFLPSEMFALLSAVVMLLLGGFEWARLVGLRSMPQTMMFSIALALFGLAVYLSLASFYLAIIVISLVTWLYILFMLSRFSDDGGRLYHNNPWILRLLAIPVLIGAWAALVQLREFNAGMVIYLVMLIAVADSAAYFAGKRWGRNKLAPILSPGKTLEGMVGALLASAIWSLFGAFYFELQTNDWFYFILLSMVSVLLSIAGDLFESLLKRQAGAKDSGSILPGHGGVLDRMDSALAAMPFFTLGIIWGGVVLQGGVS